MLVVSSETVVASETALALRSLTVLCSVETAAAFSVYTCCCACASASALAAAACASVAVCCACFSCASFVARSALQAVDLPLELGAQGLNLLFNRGTGRSLPGCGVLLGRSLRTAGLRIGNNETGCQKCRGSRISLSVSFGPLFCSWNRVGSWQRLRTQRTQLFRALQAHG